MTRHTMAPGCCSAVEPCSHQRNDPTTICETCQRAALAQTEPAKPSAALAAAENAAAEVGTWSPSKQAWAKRVTQSEPGDTCKSCGKALTADEITYLGNTCDDCETLLHNYDEDAPAQTEPATPPPDLAKAFKKLDDDSLDAICEVIGSPALYNSGKSEMRRWFLGRLRRLWNLPETDGAAS